MFEDLFKEKSRRLKWRYLLPDWAIKKKKKIKGINKTCRACIYVCGVHCDIWTTTEAGEVQYVMQGNMGYSAGRKENLK